MLQELFRIPFLNLPVYGYGLMLVLGVWCAVELARRLANRLGLVGDDFVTVGIIALVSGLAGARISHVLENWSVYTDSDRSAWANFVAAINLANGGLTFYGGFIFATIVLIAFAKLKRIPLRLGMDIVAPALMIGLAFGRVGCLLNGCCWGQICDTDDVPWAVEFPYGSPAFDEHVHDGDIPITSLPRDLIGYRETPDGLVPAPLSKEEVRKDPRLSALAGTVHSLPVHPTQIYSVFNALLIAGISVAYLTTRPAPGRVFGLMLLLYAPARFTLETLRVNTKLTGNLTYSMWISVIVVGIGVIYWLACGVFEKWMRSRTSENNPSSPPATASV